MERTNISLNDIMANFLYSGEVRYIKGFQNKDILIIDDVYELNLSDLKKEAFENGEYVGETIERYSKYILRAYIKDIRIRNFYAYMMREMIRNVYEHSKAEKGYLFIYKSRDGKELGFKVIDNGIGLKKSLNENPSYKIDDYRTAVLLAVRPGVSRAYKRDITRDDVWQNSGFGLYMISSICKKYGNFSLSSGNFEVNIRNYSNNNYLKYKKNKIKGTEVTISIRLDLVRDIPKLLRSISLRGNILAEENRIYKIKTASQASTLIEE